METMDYELLGEVYKLNIRKGSYRVDDSIALELVEVHQGTKRKRVERFAPLTMHVDFLSNNEVCIDTNNCSGAKKLMRTYKLGRPTGRCIHRGCNKYPIYKLNMKNVDKYVID